MVIQWRNPFINSNNSNNNKSNVVKLINPPLKNHFEEVQICQKKVITRMCERNTFSTQLIQINICTMRRMSKNSKNNKNYINS
jgi:hypothetical protein